MAKFKNKESFKGSKRKTVTYKGTPIRLSGDFPAETLQARREWHDLLKCWKENIYKQGYFTQQGYHSKLKER